MILGKNKPSENALEKACKTWAGSKYHRGECEDPYYQLCFRNTDPLDSEFRRIAEEIFRPLIEHQKEIEK
jgi:exodeoxyribonuclease V gamma subunit